jgi:hypothetical protein
MFMFSEIHFPVDFNNRDEDGAVRLVTHGLCEFIAENNLTLVSGLLILMTDGELIAEGTVSDRSGMWVATINRWLKTGTPTIQISPTCGREVF